MPRRRQPPRLWQRSDGSWIILDGGRQKRTGTTDEAEARQALGEYLITASRERRGPAAAGEITCGEILEAYYEARRGEVAAPDRLRYAVRALAPFWADLTADAVKGSTCQRYVRERGVAQSTARRELGTLQAALTMAHREGLLIHPVQVTLPARSEPRDRWLTRAEVRALLRAASPHLRRFIIIALMTGRRKRSILRLRWTPALDAGWIDTARNRITFRGRREAETAKRRGEIPMPRQLSYLARRWQAEDGAGAAHVIQWEGEPVASIKRAWREAAARAGLEDVRPHDLKRTAVTWAFQRGMTMEDATGWFETTAATLEAVYKRHSPEFHRRALAAVERIR